MRLFRGNFLAQFLVVSFVIVAVIAVVIATVPSNMIKSGAVDDQRIMRFSLAGIIEDQGNDVTEDARALIYPHGLLGGNWA